MIYTYSKFNYGFNITVSNNRININEGSGELAIELGTGSYTIDEFTSELQVALNTIGSLDYTVSFSRSTHKFAITGSAPFSILLASGSNIGQSFATLIGFDGIADLTGLSTYTATSRAGFEYYPQFMLQSYVPPENYKESNDAVTNKTASGRVEVVRFGLEQKAEMDIKFITSKPMDGIVIKNNVNGLENALDFLSDVSQKNRFEFVPDVSNPSVFYKVILESFPGFSNGTGFKLKELFSQNLPDIYETGVFTLRVVV